MNLLAKVVKWFFPEDEPPRRAEEIDPPLEMRGVNVDTDDRIEPVVEVSDEKPDEPSYIRFDIDNDLKVQLSSNINTSTLKAMIKEEYLNDVEAESDEVIQLAAVAMCGDIIENIIDNVNEANS